ncbi:TPA: hypothetical protein N0F65_009560 [Lagenidium giganteum]|uniref:Amidohydrolase-related domain-containing protein n=1 Tax=Lagenidium giganteum TaxID=4803 RepID=A0AAV2YR02_9STRA|nr:TPA: hypothetical protein N0F65_009560 [Lagenidium giganteum]
MSKHIADLIISAAHVVPVVPRNVVLKNHAVVVKDSRIIALLPRSEALEQFQATEVRDLKDHILMPGLVNGHGHSAMTLLRGLSDDKSLCEWLSEDIWPAEAKFVSPEFVHDGVTHAAAEMIRCGTTCVNDMYFFPAMTAKAFEEIGMRAVVGQTVMEFPTAYASNAAEYLAKAEEQLEAYKGHDLIKIAMAPHAPYTVAEETMKKVNELATKYDVPIHIHMHETEAECHDSEHQIKASMSCHQSEQKCRPLANFQRLDLLSKRVVCVHMTQLSDVEIDLVAKAESSVVHCPTSNLKLASGICRVSDLLAKGVNVAIGTDGAASNNGLNMFAEMKLAAILAKVATMKSTAVPAMTALEMATLNGAKAVGLGDEVGSIEVGKRADIVAVTCEDIEMIPMYNAISHLVYVASRENVSDVWINGKCVMQGRKLQTIDELQVKASVHKWHDQIRDFHDELQAKKN